MRANELLKLDHQLCFSLYASAKEMIRLYQPFLAPLGLTYTQYICLLVLWEHERLTVKELCEKTMLDTGTITPLLKKLESAGLLTRTRSTADERIVEIALTASGIALQKRAAEIPQKLFCATGLSIEEAIALKQQLDGLILKMKVLR